jgi:hypothetical protein
MKGNLPATAWAGAPVAPAQGKAGADGCVARHIGRDPDRADIWDEPLPALAQRKA